MLLFGTAGIAQNPENTALSTTPDRSTQRFQPTDVPQESKNRNVTRVSLDIKDGTVHAALRSLAQQSGKAVVWDTSDPKFNKKISLSIRKVTFADALLIVLRQAGLTSLMAADGETIMIRAKSDSTPGAATQAAVGAISGQVLDSATGKGIVGATVTALYSKAVAGAAKDAGEGKSSTAKTQDIAVTTEDGRFKLRSVPSGKHMLEVRAFGYRPATKSIEVVPGQAVMPSVVLAPRATQLSGVVTTATGEQRKIEVGNDITTVRVDSIVRTMPVSNMSDLLATRVPGLYAAPTSGNPGAPTRIRIRGLTSVSEANDPIIIVDGVRVASQQIEGSENLAMSSTGNARYLVSSPLDMIDVNSIETVEVLKGPSAVALYGSDAANGVIIVKTKRGQVGPPRVNISAEFGTTTIPGKWPNNYQMWGHSASNPLAAIACTLEMQVQGLCKADSLTTYQILNDPRRTVLGRGMTQTYRGGVSGSNGGMTYSLNGSIVGTMGVVKLPGIDRTLLVQSGQVAPSWLRRPESDTKKGGALSVGMDIGRFSRVTFSSQLMHSSTLASPLRSALAVARTAPPPVDGGGVLGFIPDYRMRISSQTLKSTNALDVKSVFGPRLETSLTGGVDATSRTDIAKLGAGECFALATCKNNGMYNTGTQSGTVTTITGRATSPIHFRNLLSFRSTVGIDYNRSGSRNLMVEASGIPAGATSGNGAELIKQSQGHNDRITAGVFLATNVGIADRWFFPLALRRDAGSALGSSIMPQFPNLGLSYVLSDDSWFQALPGASAISMFRLRVAYGQAGKQPGVSSKDRNYLEKSVTLDGQAFSYMNINNIGNTQLRPERTAEYEGGLDLEVFNNRISTKVTLYRKGTTDLLTTMELPLSIAGGSSQQVNIGNVINIGVNASAEIVPIETSRVRVTHSANFTLNRNRLTKIGSLLKGSVVMMTGVGPNTGLAIGYPLYGYWARPIVGVVDLNGDGLVSATEYALSDSALYLGSPDPRYAISSSHTITMMGSLSITGELQYENGLTQRRSESSSRISSKYDPKSSLAVQAITLYSDLNKIQTVSVLRFQTLSIGYYVPKSVTSRLLRNRTMRVALYGKNLGLWTNYRGLDPNVNNSMSEINEDNGVVPTPRVWQLSIGIN